MRRSKRRASPLQTLSVLAVSGLFFFIALAGLYKCFSKEPELKEEVPAVQAELFNVQVTAVDDEAAVLGAHDDGGLVKALHLLHPRDGEAAALVQGDAVGGRRAWVLFVKGHRDPVLSLGCVLIQKDMGKDGKICFTLRRG